MSVTLYGITHLFLPSNSTQKSIYRSTNNSKHPLKAQTLFCLFRRWSLAEIQTFLLLQNDDGETYGFYTSSTGDSIQSELWTLKNSFFRVHLNLESAWDYRLKPVPQYS